MAICSLATALLALPALHAPTGANRSPVQPTITEPASDGQVVNPADVHMETGPFSDPDAGDAHLCSDWEIWLSQPSERVWSIACIGGVERVHTHLGDGLFEGSHAGRTELLENRGYELRARHSDDSGDDATRWSPWAVRTFVTGSALSVFPLELEDVLDAPAPRWVRSSNESEVILPGGQPAGFLRVESGTGALLLEIAGLDGTSNAVTNPAELPAHVAVRVHVEAGSAPIVLPSTDLVLFDDHCGRHRLLLPSLQLAPGEQAYFWISSTGTSYVGNGAQTAPDFTQLARGLTPPWHPRQPGFRVEPFAYGFRLPVNIAFVPDPGAAPGSPFFYVTELYGTIKLVRRDGSTGTYASGLLNYNPTGSFPGSGEQGLTGIAVHPTSGDVYAAMLYDSALTPGRHYPKVVRFTSTDGGHTAATQTTILDMDGELQGQSHQISSLSFGPDGKLYVHMGDGFDASTGQNLGSFRGKILRIESDGSPAQDNPFYDPNDGIDARDHVFAYGLRNPFGGGWRAEDSSLYMVENGPSVDRFAKIVAGRNYLWNGSDASMTHFALHNWNPATAPVNVVFVQPSVFGGSAFPASKMGHAFVTESGPTYASGPQARGKRITEWILDANGALVAGPIPFLQYAGIGKASAAALAAGPDGLYMSELYADDGSSATQPGARILRIRYDPSFDCNENGIDDTCELAAGLGSDVNGNQIPDECDCAGVSFCQATLNSTGFAAGIWADGSCSVAANDLVLLSGPVPDQPGIFFYAQNRLNGGAGIPFQNGFRCAGGTVRRFPTLVASGNLATFAVDFTAHSAAAAITPGTTWHFQYWFRDPAAGGANANLSKGLTISFE